MNQERFDELTRTLATNRLSRRQVLKGLAAGMVGAILGSVPLNMRARPALATGSSCAKQVYSKGTNFIGNAITADVQFFDSLEIIDRCARSNNVFIYVTNSYRKPGTIIKDPVHDQAKPGNHEAGHAIDMNVHYYDANGVLTPCSCERKTGCPPTTCLGGVLPTPVQDFIDCVKDEGLTWGGDYKKPPRDPVHIDDNLAHNDPALWRERITAMLESGTCPANETCDANGVCTDEQTGGCNVTCNPPKVPNPDKNCDCECPGQSCAPPMAINPDTCVCECPISCPPNQVPNPNTCECVCPAPKTKCGNNCCNPICERCDPNTLTCESTCNTVGPGFICCSDGCVGPTDQRHCGGCEKNCYIKCNASGGVQCCDGICTFTSTTCADPDARPCPP